MVTDRLCPMIIDYFRRTFSYGQRLWHRRQVDVAEFSFL